MGRDVLGSGGGGYGPFVASAYATSEEKARADFICDGTSDETEINSAIDQLAGTVPAQGSPGGRVQLLGPRFNVAASIIGKSYITLAGINRFYTDIRAAGNFVGTEMFRLSSVNDEFVGVQDLRLNGAYVAGISGVAIDNTGGTFSFADPSHTFKDLYINGTMVHGFWTKGNCRATEVQNVRVIDPGIHGFFVESPDSNFVQCQTGSAGSHGFHVASSNCRFAACKAWYSGNGDGTVGNGFHVPNPRNEFAACEAQDNACHGFYIGSRLNTFASCIADSNAWYSTNPTQNANLWDGFHIATGAGQIGMSACIAMDKNESARGFKQRYGLNFSAAAKDSTIDIVGDGNVTGLVGGTMTGLGLFLRASGLRSDGTTRDTFLIHNGQTAVIP